MAISGRANINGIRMIEFGCYAVNPDMVTSDIRFQFNEWSKDNIGFEIVALNTKVITIIPEFSQDKKKFYGVMMIWYKAANLSNETKVLLSQVQTLVHLWRDTENKVASGFSADIGFPGLVSREDKKYWAAISDQMKLVIEWHDKVFKW